MKSSRRRYLFVKVVVPAALVNIVVNALIGAAVFRPGHDVPLLGPLSVGADTLVGSFLIAFLTVAGESAAARIEARSGRVRGFALRSAWSAWPRKHPLLVAIGMGFVWVFLLGVPLMRAIQARGIVAMPRDVFLAFKVGYAGIAGVLAALAGALLGLAPEPPAADDPRWCQDPRTPHLTYPFDYMDKATLAGTQRERGCSFTPTWALGVRGHLEPEHVRRALADLALRYPSLTTRVQALDGVPPVAKKYRYARDPAFQVSAIFDVVDLRSDAAGLAALERELRSRHLDLFTEFPVTLTMAITADDSCRLIFRQHHAIADGRAFIALLVDFAAFVEDARTGRRPAPEALTPIGRRGETEALGLSPLRLAAKTAGGFVRLAGSVVRGASHPLVPLRQNRSNDYSGENGTVHWVVRDDVLGAWDAARKRVGVSLNTFLTGALMLANERRHRAAGLPLGRTTAQLLMETRPRGTSFVSFANHLTFLEAEADLGRVESPSALLRSIQAQVVKQRDRGLAVGRLLGERAFALFVPLEVLTKMIFETTRPAYNLNFSNLIPLEFKALGGRGWVVDEVRITTPVAPRHGIVLTVIRYRGELVFNFNYKSTAATREETEELCGAFQAVLEEMSAS